MTAKIFPNNVATVLGSLEIFTGLGLILGPPVGGWFYQSFGYEVPFMLLGCFLLIMVPSTFLSCPLLFNLSPGYVGLIMLGLSLPYCLASPLMGYFTDKYPATRSWFMVSGAFATAVGFCLLGPAPFLNFSGPLWLLVVMLGVIGFSLGMTALPTFPEIITCVYEQGFEEGLSTLGMVSGLFGAVWSFGMFYGPIVGGLITQNLNFEWAAVIEGGLAFLGAFLLALHYIFHKPQPQRQLTEPTTEEEETTPLLNP
ncbi:hypothetical protein WMY93_017194 [Mugilogobius chulae]|uniref:Major facilitator superfamily (MFS) profile domain-containing protein n=1 Tax=Mugilogobius chulae TaxID=88201 RepID=A0AAW0NXR5_9GOBI